MTTTTSDGGAGSGPPEHIRLTTRVAYALVVAAVEIVARLLRGRR